jgi:signal transduction histidine kinase
MSDIGLRATASAAAPSDRTVTPAIRSLLRGLVAVHAAATAWGMGTLALTWPRWDRQTVAIACVAAMAATSAAGFVLLRRSPDRLLDPRVVIAHLAIAVIVQVGDGWSFESGAMFTTRQGFAGSWPLVASLHAAVALGPAAAAIGLALGLARGGGVLANNTDLDDLRRVASIAASATLYGLAAATAGWTMQLLRRSEQEVAETRVREEFARTMHDTILQTLALVERRGDPTLAADARKTDRVLRAYLFGGHDSDDPPADLATALKRSATEAAQRYDLDVSVSVLDDERGPPMQVIDALAGAVGEAVTNIGKHAQATKAVVFAEVDDDGSVRVSVRDDGVGFDVDNVKLRAGISQSIIGRLQQVGGRVELRSVPGSGTEVLMWT